MNLRPNIKCPECGKRDRDIRPGVRYMDSLSGCYMVEWYCTTPYVNDEGKLRYKQNHVFTVPYEQMVYE